MNNSQSMDIVKLENTAVMLSYYLYLTKNWAKDNQDSLIAWIYLLANKKRGIQKMSLDVRWKLCVFCLGMDHYKSDWVGGGGGGPKKKKFPTPPPPPHHCLF